MNQIERITQMETILNESMKNLDQFQSVFSEFKTTLPQLKKLSHYYGSATWFDDRKAFEHHQIPDNIACGVLGEDVGFDLITSHRQLALDMLEVATQLLKEY